MHICHVITRLIIGGAQENTLLTCAGLQQRGHEVTLISGPTRGPEGTLMDEVRAASYRYIEVPDLVRPVNPWLDARAQRELAALFSRLKPDLVHTHSSKAGIIARFAAERARVPLVVHTIHGMSFNRTQPWLVRRLYAWVERLAARRTHALIAVADAMIEQSVAAGVAPRARFETIYSGMAVERFTPTRYDGEAVRRAWGIEPGDAAESRPIVVGTIARLFRRKGYEQLLPIMQRAAETEPRLRFVWVGDGAMRAEYERELARRGLRQRAHVVGLVPPDEIPRMISGFDILAHTSQWEGLPRAVVQALLMQKPVVAFALDGTPEVVIDGETGRTVANGDEAGFSQALLELARNPEGRRRMGRNGRQHCLDRFDARRMVDRIEALYARLAERAEVQPAPRSH